eukprot:TRINITY_DN33729_c0_g1_i2.p1 TRINITY_DN33729_c0_g1~~TRINITY_DN33729_c0_g1_i2.p1  ORF type:complete len:249 (+),score=58.99 TRINITY_DN33729_c0_g1_i2:100-846(+)
MTNAAGSTSSNPNVMRFASAAGQLQAAAALLGVSVDASEAELRHAYRDAAKRYHPDKPGEDSAADFVRLKDALDLLLARLAQTAQQPAGAGAGGSTTPRAAGMKESERLDKHFFGTHFNSDQFDPRAWDGEADAAAIAAAGLPVQCVWRCKSCPEQSSVCCRMKPKKHSCICGHKVEAHSQAKNFKCGMSGCKCPRLKFHVQQFSWEAKCRCKHHVKEHQAGGPPWRCSKILPGKDKKACDSDCSLWF